MVSVSKWFGGIAAPLTIVLAACSASSERAPGDDVGEIVEAFGEASCLSATAEATFAGKIGEYDSPTTYSNAKCYKSVVVSVSNLASSLQDIVITDVHVPSVVTKPPVLDPNGRVDPSKQPPRTRAPGGPLWLPPQTQADCEALFIGAILYQTSGGAAPLHRTSSGVWYPYTTPPVGGFPAGYCTVPAVVFGGASSKSTGFDVLVPGASYTVVATYRGQNTSHAATLPLKVFTPAVTCGGSGQACCATTEQCGTEIDTSLSCRSGTCNACGGEGQQSCGAATEAHYCLNQTHTQTIVNDKCTQCGDTNQACCDNAQCNGGGLVCTGGTCKLPPPCGGQNQACCGGGACGSGLTCQSGNTCRVPPPCGGQNQMCCNGSGCNGGLTCQSGSCAVPPVVQCGGLTQLCCNGVSCNAGTGLLCQAPVGGGPNRCFAPSTMCGAPGQFCCNDSGRSSGYCDDQTYPGTTCDGFHCNQN